jgi:hypothetical protein
MATKKAFGISGGENGEKAWHTLLHVMLKYCGCVRIISFLPSFWDFSVIKE